MENNAELDAPVPVRCLVISDKLQAAIEAENAEIKDPDTLTACEGVYAKQGEAPFDPLNSADMLIRAFVLAEAHDSAKHRKS